MLKSLIVENLFGSFSYDIKFSESENDKIRFITAPNGYGKTTILRLINGLYNRDFSVFFSVPFSSLTFQIDDVFVRIEQCHESIMQETVDEEEERFITVLFGADYKANGFEITLQDLEDASNKNTLVGNLISQLDLYFDSEKCVFVDDRRLLRENTDASELVRFTDVVKSKLKEDNEESQKLIETFTKIVERCDFVNKRLDINPLYGFRFVAEDEYHTKLSMNALSSGEKHILLQSLYLLFEAPAGTLVLIDEPEMSFHLSWQGDYLRNLKDIVSLRQIQCIISTHSPFIFESEYSLSVDLFEISNPENSGS